jgi:hypothetical protein
VEIRFVFIANIAYYRSHGDIAFLEELCCAGYAFVEKQLLEAFAEIFGYKL